jgi:protein-tyrosine sulfotransferase
MIRSFLRRLIKGKHNFLESQRYNFPVQEAGPGRDALVTVKAMRSDHPSAIILHGVMPRSGTVFASELLGQHPDLFAYPLGTWEFPFLRLKGDIQIVYEKYVSNHPVDREQITENDFLMLFSSSLISHLYRAVPDNRRMLLKIPLAEYLPYFYTAFPYENLIVLMRDGRDVVSSTIKTWPNYSFVDVCKWWNNSARLIIHCNRRFTGQSNYCFARYEDVVKDPMAFILAVCNRFGLEKNRYPFEKINDLPLYGSSVERAGKKVSWAPVEKPKGFNPIGRWSDWSAGQKRIFKKIAGQTLLDLDYCQDLNW